MGTKEDGSVKEPINREPEVDRLTQSYLTPSDPKSTDPDSKSKPIAYERNHGPIQHLDGNTHRLTIRSDPALDSNDNLPSQRIHKTFSVDQIRSEFKPRTITAALQCAGNRRHEMRERVADVQGIDWADGAVLNARWGGVPLRDVLLETGLQEPSQSVSTSSGDSEGLHVHFSSAQPTQQDTYYGSSIPLSTALDPERECLLATDMNGAQLTPAHGYPLRVIIPGIIGARSVKWLDTITIAANESQNFYQQKDYKILSGDVAEKVKKAEDEGDSEKRGRIVEGVEPMGDNPVNCVVSVPAKDGDSIKRDQQGRIYVRGYAIPKGKDGPVVNVEVSVDQGKSWLEATILDQGDEHNTHASNKDAKESTGTGKFAWVLWECSVPVDGAREDVSIWSKATDRGGNTMDVEHPEGGWNLRGVGYNAVEGRRGIKIV